MSEAFQLVAMQPIPLRAAVSHGFSVRAEAGLACTSALTLCGQDRQFGHRAE